MLLKVKIKKATVDIFKNLESLGVIKSIINENLPLGVKEEEFVVDTIYSSKKEYGGHKLIYVKTNKTTSDLNSHPDKEDILLINNMKKFKKLIWVFSKSNSEVLDNKIKSGQLNSDDFIAVDIPYNDPDLSFFTINEYYPHYEVTISGPGEGPFFLLPSHLN